MGRDHRIVSSGFHSKSFIGNLWKAISNGKIWKGEIKNRAKDGSLYWVDTTIVPFLDHEGKPIRYVAIRSDITDRKKAEDQIIKMNKELEATISIRTAQLKKASEEMEAFTYSVAHDLRAPLRGIIGFTSILQIEYADKLDDEARRLTGIIKSNTSRMGRLIDDLLAFSRVETQKLVKSNIDTNKMVQEIVTELLLQNKDRSPIVWKIAELPEVKVDVGSFGQVWINLISNAVKYTGHTSNPEISIGYYQDNNEIVFYIRDNGIGFDEKYKHKLFKVFQRLHSAEEFSGTGIGLALVEKIISKHGGRIWAEGKVNEGACFSFSLPVN
jgi:light-regulated signal transduction histidine kinase (bacteriophytochrome)